MVKRLDIGVYGARGIPSTYSGYETFLTVLLPELVRRDHRVTMYCREGAVERESAHSGVSKRFLPALPTKSLSTITHGAVASLAARRAGHDVVLVVNVANAFFAPLHKWTGQSVVLNVDGQEWLRGKWGPLARRYFLQSARRARAATTGLITDSAAMGELYRDQFGASSTVIPYCWTELIPSSESILPDQYGLRAGQYFCQAGRLNPENNAVPVARAFHRSRSKMPLVILGSANYDSPVLRELKALAELDDRIRLVGHVANRSDYACIVKNAAVYVHAHSVGGVNPSLIEAMGVGAHILALGTDFNREALGVDGEYFAAFGDQLTATFDRLPDSAGEAGERSRSAAYVRVLSTYDLPSIADAYEDLLLRAAASPARRNINVATRWQGDAAAVRG